MSWLTYLMQVNIYLTIFYLFYLMLLRNETFFQYNRIYLLSTAAMALLIPVAQSEWVVALFMSDNVYEVATDFNTLIIIASPPPTESNNLSLGQIINLIYVAGVMVSSGILLSKLLRLRNVLEKAPARSAFSFFNWIKIDDDLAHNDTIYEHEKVHARQLHSADNLFIELLMILNWFNPILYAYKKALKHLHEFIADETAAKKEMSKSDYALILLSNTMGISTMQLTNNFFNHSLLKRRIFMLHKERSKRAGILKYALSAPLFIAMMIFSSASLSEVKMPGLTQQGKRSGDVNSLNLKQEVAQQAKDQSFQEIAKVEMEAKLAKPIATSINSTKPADTSLHQFSDIDKLPEFPGGQQKFYEYVGSKFKYPAEARKKGVTGRVTLRFIVEKDGSLTDIRILREPGMGTGEEAVRVLQNSPKWKPGMNKGEPVRVEYTLPIQLNLAAESNDEPEKKSSLELRGPNSPIYILDGKEIDKLTFENLDKNEIQSVSVMKDESAIVKYGNKGKNGVIEITMKK